MFKAQDAREIICPVCGKKEKEPFFGIGFLMWQRLMDIFYDKTKMNPIICPECRGLLLAWLNGTMNMVPKKK
jgi:hypothetical protein